MGPVKHGAASADRADNGRLRRSPVIPAGGEILTSGSNFASNSGASFFADSIRRRINKRRARSQTTAGLGAQVDSWRRRAC